MNTRSVTSSSGSAVTITINNNALRREDHQLQQPLGWGFVNTRSMKIHREVKLCVHVCVYGHVRVHEHVCMSLGSGAMAFNGVSVS